MLLSLVAAALFFAAVLSTPSICFSGPCEGCPDEEQVTGLTTRVVQLLVAPGAVTVSPVAVPVAATAGFGFAETLHHLAPHPTIRMRLLI